ncbi:MAG: hypothetical protein ACO1N7_03755 [Sphingobacteriaceae bacterium]
MARQEGVFPFSGKVGDVVGFKRGKQNFSKAASKEYLLTEESKKSGTEFGRGSTAAALVKQAFGPLMLRPFEDNLHNRLSEALRKVIRSGPVVNKGNRNVFDGNLSLLKGFEFSTYTAFDRLLFPLPDVVVSGDVVKVNIPPFSWTKSVKSPEKASRMVLGMMCGFFDFNTNAFQTTLVGNLPIERNSDFRGAGLSIPVPEHNELAVIVLVTIFFDYGDSQRHIKVDNRNYQAGIILDAVHIREGKVVVFEPEALPVSELKPEIVPDIMWEINS